MNVSLNLVKWYNKNKRELPWRHTDNPYFIWLSEIILQQTRVSYGIKYYLEFIRTFPTIDSLANADEDHVLKMWQGLGYYSRARNLHKAAKTIQQNYSSTFPKKYEDIINLQGVGPYTAAAISSFAFKLPYAAVDGNVIRFIGRFFGEEAPYDTYQGRKIYQNLANKILDKDNSAEHNQAIIEFGALQCTFRSPNCLECPFSCNCVAYNTNSIYNLPVKSKQIKVKDKYIHYLFIQKSNSILLGKRKFGIWKGLYDLPSIELSSYISEESISQTKEWEYFFKNNDVQIEFVSEEYQHKLSHQFIYAKFWHVKSDNVKIKGFVEVNKEDIIHYPVSVLLHKFFCENNLN